ncbi:MAG: hypothetical protein JJ899_00615 [Alphaproteobacteria bacterium]|nr:hypothetical protein [Alphaproteobacteria bacterium]
MFFRSTVLLALFAAAPVLVATAHADIRNDIARCAGISDDGARLQCFDNAAAAMQAERNAAASRAAEALKREFRFDRGALTGPLSLRVNVSGNLVLSRDTAAGREVEETARRIGKALGDIDGWSLSIVVHGGKVALSRGNPYSGGELLAQSRAGMARSGLPEDRYTVALGPDAEPELWDDGRVRNANEHIDIEIVGLGETPTR